MNHNSTDDGPVKRRPSDDNEQGLVLVTCLVIEHGVVECLENTFAPVRLSGLLRKVDFRVYWGLCSQSLNTVWWAYIEIFFPTGWSLSALWGSHLKVTHMLLLGA
jgi:hypothetical protein